MSPISRSTRRRALRAAAAVCLVASATVLAWPGPAGAEAPEVTGYWNRLKPQTPSQLGNPIPPPPDVPQDGLLVANDPVGPQAMSALRFLATEPTEAVLTLQAATGSNVAAATILACPVTSTWDQAIDGVWATRPQSDCASGRSVEGEADTEGMAMSWEIGPGFFRGESLVPTIEIALVPDGVAPFRAVFEKPGADALSADGPLYQPPTFGSEPEPLPPPFVPAPIGGGSPGGFGGLGSGFPPPAPPATTATTAPADTDDEVALSERVAADLPVPDSGSDRLLAVLLLALLGIGLFLASMQHEVRPPRLIGGLAGRRGTGTGPGGSPGRPDVPGDAG